MRFGSQMHLHIDESIAAAPSATVSAAQAHVNVPIEGRNCAPDAAKLIAKWPPPISFTTLSAAAAPRRGRLSLSSIACCRAERRTSRSCSRRGTSSSRDALHACAHRPAAAASSKQQAMCACSSGGSSSRSCTIADAALYSFLVYSRLYSKKRAVERYTATSHTSNHAPPELYSLYSLYTALIQRCILYSYPSQTRSSPSAALASPRRPRSARRAPPLFAVFNFSRDMSGISHFLSYFESGIWDGICKVGYAKRGF